MGFFTGGNKSIDNVSSDIAPLRSGVSDYLAGKGYGDLFPGTPDINDPSLGPYKILFAQRRARALAQAKESVGNLTGTGLSTAIGRTAGQSAAEENATLAQILEARRTGDANRYAQLISSLSTSGVAPPTLYHQPGFLDYLFSAGKTVASALPFRTGPSGTPGNGPTGGGDVTGDPLSGGYV